MLTITFLALLMGSPAEVPETSTTVTAVQSDGVTDPAKLRKAVIRLSAHWVERNEYDFDHYAAALKQDLNKWWTNAEFIVVLGPDDKLTLAKVEGEMDEDTREELLDAIGDHFFDEYESSLDETE